MLENDQQIGKLESRASEKKTVINSIELNFTGLNVFALNELSNGIAIRTDALNLSSNGEKSKVSIEGLKLMHLNSMVQVSVFQNYIDVHVYQSFSQSRRLIYPSCPLVKNNSALVCHPKNSPLLLIKKK